MLNLFVSLIFAPLFASAQSQWTEPKAPKIHFVREMHGHRWNDPYFWMKTPFGTQPSVKLLQYIKAENEYVAKNTQSQQARIDALYKEIKGHEVPGGVDEASAEEPEFSVEDGSKPKFSKLVRKTTSGTKETLIDLSDHLSEYQSASADYWKLNSNSTHLILASTINGEIIGPSRFFLIELQTKKVTRVFATKGLVAGFGWASDPSQFYHVTHNLAYNSGAIFTSTIQAPETHITMFKSDDISSYLETRESKDGRYLFVDVCKYSRRDSLIFDKSNFTLKPRKLWPSEDGVYTQIDSLGDRFFVMTNRYSKNRQFYDLYLKDGLDDQRPLNLVARGSLENDVAGVELFDDRFFVARRFKASGTYDVYSMLSLKKTASLRFPEPYYEVSLNPDQSPDTKTVLFTKKTAFSRGTVFEFDSNQKMKVVSEVTIPNFDASLYEHQVVSFKSQGGEMIPMSLIFKKSFGSKNRPTYYGGYGCYGQYGNMLLGYHHAYDLTHQLSLLDRGVMIAYVHARGGGEKGLRWARQGHKTLRSNTDADFLMGAEFLLNKGFTAPGKLVIHGFSGSGLMVGNALNARPELFKAAVIHMGFLDMLNTLLDPKIPQTSIEWELWGNPNVRKDFLDILTHSPYDNIRAKNYPSVLINTAIEDWNVGFFESVKYAAKLKAFQQAACNLIYLKTLMPGEGDHGGTYNDYAKDAAFDLNFVLTHLGL